MFIGGNWKCNGGKKSIKELVKNVLNKAQFDEKKLEVVVCPTGLHLLQV